MSVMTERQRARLRSVLFYGLVLAVLAAYLFPFYWMVLSSLKTQIQNIAFPPLFLFTPTLENYQSVFVNNPFFLFLWNSLVIGAGSTLLGLVLGLPAAYGIARFQKRGVALGFLIARIAPGISYLVPWFIIFSDLHMVGSYSALILAHLTVGLPLTVWIMIGFFEDVPQELEDAAFIDGANRFEIFLKVALPIVKPGIATAGILSFIQSWNTFMYSVVLSNSETRTLPVMVLTLLIQRHIVAGLSMGSVKG